MGRPIIRKLQAFNAYAYCALLAFFYFLLIIILPANKISMHDYNLSALQYHILYLLIATPLVAIWFIAFNAYTKLRQYGQKVSKTDEGVDFNRLADGYAWIAWGLPIPAIITFILYAVANDNPSFVPTSIIIANYVGLIIPLIAFSAIGSATRGLLKRAKIQISLSDARSIIFLFVIFGVLFCYLTFKHLNVNSINDSNNPYYLPVWLLIATIIIPYLYAWFVGLLAAFEIVALGKSAKGLIYRQALQLLSAGLVAVIFSSIAFQYLNSVHPRVAHLTLDAQLLKIYLVRLLAAIGFLMIIAGARRLKKIEDV